MVQEGVNNYQERPETLGMQKQQPSQQKAAMLSADTPRPQKFKKQKLKAILTAQ